jgi:hypothetical protein
MNLIQRVISIITKPKEEWLVINGETPNTNQIIMSYVLPLTLAGAAASFIGAGIIGRSFLGVRFASINLGVVAAITALIVGIASVFVSSFIIDALAPSFGSEKNMGRSMQLVAYSYTPSFVGALLSFYPPIGIIGSLFGFYGLYLLWLGLPTMKKTPEDKQAGYFIVSLLVIIVAWIVIGLVIAGILTSIFATSVSNTTLGL